MNLMIKSWIPCLLGPRLANIKSQAEPCDLESRSHPANENEEMIPGDIPGPGSVVALLMNVQGLLRMAVESAKHREQKYNSEKGKYNDDSHF